LMGFSTQWWVGLRRFAFAHRDLDPDEWSQVSGIRRGAICDEYQLCP
jgi:hypothetical protein